MKISTNKDNMMELDQGVLELFVDQRYIGGKFGVKSGSSFETFGLLPYRWYKKETDKNPSKFGTMNIPSMLEFRPITMDENKSVKIYPESDDKKYMIMRFEPGVPMWPKYNVQKLTNAQMFVDLILGGKLDNNIPYTMIAPAWIKNLKLNNIALGVPIVIIELIVHAMCRDKKTGKPFGEVIGKDPNHALIGYEFLDIRHAAAASIFGALSFEDQNAMLDIAINTTLQDKEQRISPLEKIIKY